jgi:hypothetical protein
MHVLFNNSHHEREQWEHAVYRSLLSMIPGIEDRLMNSSEAEIRMISDLVSTRRRRFSAVLMPYK